MSGYPTRAPSAHNLDGTAEDAHDVKEAALNSGQPTEAAPIFYAPA